MQLPLNCEVTYLPNFLTTKEAAVLFSTLLEIIKTTSYTPQSADGKTYAVNFNKVMFLDQDLLDNKQFPEKIWGPTRPWFHQLSIVKEKIEQYTRQKFQVCVLIYYPNGSSGVDYHSDLIAYGDTSVIPSVSLGQERIFKFKAKESGEELAITLADGSLVIMGKHCQERYEHSLPVHLAYKHPRINLTFRKYGFDN